MVFKIIILTVLIVLAIGLFIGIVRTWQTQKSPLQKEFIRGKIPRPLPNELFKGRLPSKTKTTWQGKKFNQRESRGVNVFLENGKHIESYPFKTYIGKGLVDKQTDVFKIDYNLKENDWWVRGILDEVTETKPGHLLGKLHYRLFPGLSFSLGYFILQK